MSTRDAHLADVLCHCDQTAGLPEDGHPLGTPGCTSVIKAGRYTDSGCSRDHFYLAHCPACHGSVRGTCPSCGKYGRIVGIKYGRGGDTLSLGMVRHRADGRECPGAGKVPTETTFKPGRAQLLAETAADERVAS